MYNWFVNIIVRQHIKVFHKLNSPCLAHSSSKSEYRMDDIDRSVWLSQQTKWIDKSVVEKQQKRCGDKTPTVVSRKAGYIDSISFTGQPQWSNWSRNQSKWPSMTHTKNDVSRMSVSSLLWGDTVPCTLSEKQFQETLLKTEDILKGLTIWDSAKVSINAWK